MRTGATEALRLVPNPHARSPTTPKTYQLALACMEYTDRPITTAKAKHAEYHPYATRALIHASANPHPPTLASVDCADSMHATSSW